ncbi:MAG TPA: glycosyltransferase family 1 protein [Acidimicrobiia bacterium]|nr:glycosyltransferase family 1 protein [Acidimicrobiia bacterium]
MGDDLRLGLHVGQLLQPVPGGIGRYTSVLAGELQRGGIAVTAFAAGERPGTLPGGVRHVDLGFPRGRFRNESWAWLRRPVLDLDVDIVHAPSLAVPPTGGRPLVVTVHDLAFLRLPQYFTVHGLRFHERGLRITRDEADIVVVPSRFVADELIAEGFEPGRVHVARHGMDPVPVRSDDDLAGSLARLGVDGRYVLFVGTLEPRKGVDTLVEAFRQVRRQHRDLRLVVVGARGWGKAPDLSAPGVVHLGHVSDADLDALYRSADALVYPSHYEGFGLPALEAMARGCPVVTSATTSLPEVVGDAGILVPPGRADHLAAAVDGLLDNDDLRARLAEAGPARAAEFTWADSVEAHRAAYRAAAEADHGRRAGVS